ncbi:DNA-binding IclR family transcriptional regulator [Sphingomonas vulcanisoli]|uniref:DNA-binding IclR family transcriptional regulator n=1 Tax=Sphingomonas vulcanisoli TaxID=1658060 RepID=A0ABX0TUQ0_9SPHN|nr:IclR family transcriptional regulator [Sphingomonas vulcanisoli]NIJ09242.1 DNA-binding IclR family transcriptional regulator [Sphingomonas vulcanisoli]
MADSKASDTGRVEAVERALSLLQCFRTPGEELSLAILAQRSTMYKSTILRLAGSLVRKGFLHRNSQGRFLLGPELQRLGGLSSPQIGLDDLIRPVLAELSLTALQTASFYIQDGNVRLCLLRHNSPRSARHHLEEGSRHPLNHGAAGAILRAFAGARDKASAGIRRQGWAVSLGSRDPDLAAVAVPLLNAEDELIGVLTISGLISGFSNDAIEDYRQALMQQAANLRPRLPRLSELPYGRIA